MNSLVFTNFWVLFMGYNIWGKQVSIQENSVWPTRQAYIKKITVACPTDKGDAGRLTIVANKCSIVRIPLVGIRPGDGGTLTIIANKCSFCQKCPLPNEYASASAPRPLPPSSSLIWAPPPPPARPSPPSHTCRTTPIHLEVHVWGAGFKVAGVAAITPSAWIQSMS
jgi:hypothetical protein